MSYGLPTPANPEVIVILESSHKGHIHMEHVGVYKIVRLLPPGTTLLAISDSNDDVQGVVEAYRFVEYTRSPSDTSFVQNADGPRDTSHDIEYRVKWTDGVYEWISWSEVNTYEPKRPVRPGEPLNHAHRPRINV